LTLAYLTFGLQRTLCPEQRQTYPYSTNINGATVKVYRENVTVYGKVYPFKKMQSFLATKKLNLTKEYQGVDLSWIFDADMSGACKVYDVGRSGSTTTAGNCTIAGPYGMWLSIYACDVHLSFPPLLPQKPVP
jgi:chitin synthase